MTTLNVMDWALKALARRAVNREKLREKLLKAGFGEDEIADCLTRMDGWGYLNDRQFIIDKIEGLKKKFKSRNYIAAHLRQSGLTAQLIEELLDQYYPAEMEIVIARQVLAKRRSQRNRSNVGERFFLLRSGFTEDTAERCFPEEP